MRNGWTTSRLSDCVTKIGSGATPLGGEAAYKDSGIALIRSLNVHDDGFRRKDLAFIDDRQAAKLSNVVVEPNDVLLNITGASIARCCVVPDDTLPARVNQHVTILRPASDVLLPTLLHYLLTSNDYKNRLLRTGEDNGSTRQALTKGQLQAFEIKYPTSLPEQRRIVGILDEAFAAIATAKANTEKNLQNAHALFESHLTTIFNREHANCVKRQLKEVCETITDGTHYTPKYFDQGTVFLSSRNVTTGVIDWQNVKYIDEKQHREMSKRVAPRLNDVLLAKNGTTGVAAIVDRDLPFDIYVSLALLRPTAEIRPRYLLHFVNSPGAKRQFNARLKGIGVPNLHLKEIREVVITYPTSLTKQDSVIQEIENLRAQTQRLASLYQRKLAALDELKQSLLHQAFSGQL